MSRRITRSTTLRNKQVLATQLKDLAAGNFYNSSLGPIYRLPYEILGEILLYCYPCIEFHDVISCPAATQVSRGWRAFTHSFPPLWSRMSVKWDSIGDTISPEGEGFIAVVETCLLRSGELPLSFILSADNKRCSSFRSRRCSHHNSPVVTSVMGLLLKHCSRWRDVTLEVHFPYVQPLLSLKSDRQFPALHTLSLFQCACGVSAPTGRRPTAYDPMESFKAAQNLKSLSLRQFFLPDHPPSLPWGQITHYTSILNWHDLCFLLSNMPDLTHLKLYDHYSPIGLGTTPVPLRLGRVTSMHINALGRSVASHLNILTLPKLEELFLVGCSSTDIEDSEQRMVDAFLTFLHRSSCTLKNLTMAYMSASSVLRVLDAIPAICCIHFKIIPGFQFEPPNPEPEPAEPCEALHWKKDQCSTELRFCVLVQNMYTVDNLKIALGLHRSSRSQLRRT